MNYICIEGKEGKSTVGKSYAFDRNGKYYGFVDDRGEEIWITAEQLDIYFEKEI